MAKRTAIITLIWPTDTHVAATYASHVVVRSKGTLARVRGRKSLRIVLREILKARNRRGVRLVKKSVYGSDEYKRVMGLEEMLGPLASSR